MSYVLTNDDGVDAPGIAALAQAAEELGKAIVVAPAHHLSGCSHQVTTDRPFRVRERRPGWWAVEGTPADCVRVALSRLAPQTSCVLSGLNEGGNLGTDVFHSGTVAAAREATLHGVPAIALSQYRRAGKEIDWQRSVRWMKRILADLGQRSRDPGTFWNVNLPCLDADAPDPEIIECPIDPSPLPLAHRPDIEDWHYDGDYHSRLRTPGADVDVCFSGNIAVTLLRIHY